jgi:hypothetical protein
MMNVLNIFGFKRCLSFVTGDKKVSICSRSTDNDNGFKIHFAFGAASVEKAISMK